MIKICKIKLNAMLLKLTASNLLLSIIFLGLKKTDII